MAKGGQYLLKKAKQGIKEVAKEVGEEAAAKADKKSGKGDRVLRRSNVPPEPAPAAPAVHGAGPGGTHGPAAQKIFDYAAVNPARYDMPTEPVFAAADPELTKQMVPQQSIAHLLPQENIGEVSDIRGGRALQIHNNREELGRILAQTIRDNPDANLPFYSTGTVLQGLVDKGGMDPQSAFAFLRDWAGQGAATSPRTRTPPNLRNSSYLLYREGQGNPMSKPVWEAEAPLWEAETCLVNRPGFPLIGGQHPALAHGFRTGTADPLKNPKPYTFRENWSGNMADVTADTHNIRAVLDAYDQMFPGTLQEDWFKSAEDFSNYRENHGFPAQGSLERAGIEDTLGSKTINKRKIQFEYPFMQGPTIEAAKNLGIAPAEAQERLWFAKGPRTGLKSPPMTIPDLLNSQFEVTARVLGISPEEVMKMWSQRKIPLAQNDEQQPVPGMQQTGVG
jgi:hypothetical protein